VPDKSRADRPHRVPSINDRIGRGTPSSPFVPIVSGIMWILVGIVAFIAFSTSWKYVVGIFALGVGLLFLRGGLASLVQRDERRPPR
jgi:ABC-type siderophore export system fused ATPase/permease subunit